MSKTDTGEPAKNPELAWHRHPAVVAAFAAALTVVGSVLTIGLGRAGALPDKLNPAPAPTTVLATQTVTAASTVTSPGDSSTTPAGPTGPGQVVWQHQVNLPYQNGVDIDEAHPVVLRLPDPDVEFRTATQSDHRPYLEYGGTSTRTLAGAASSVVPTYDQCLEAVDAGAVREMFPAPVGKTFCVREDDEVNPRMASVRVLAWSKETWEMVAEVTVWTVK